MKAYLLISHLRIHNANAMSSTLTIGVPAMTAWLGAVHALERKLGERRAGSGGDTTCKNSGIISQDESADL